MLGTLFDLSVSFIIGIIFCLLCGFFSMKFFVWGSVATGVLGIAYLLLPSFEAAAVFDTMTPLLLAIWTIYPRAIQGALGDMQVEYGEIGILATLVVGAVFVVPYLVGAVAGLKTWPEIHIMGLIL